MPKVDLNLDNIKDYAEEGWYLLRVENAEIKKGPKGNYVNWQLEISDPDYTEDVPPIYHVTSFSAPSMVRDFLKSCSFEWDADGSFHTEDVIGCELEGKLGTDEYEGKIKNVLEKHRQI